MGQDLYRLIALKLFTMSSQDRNWILSMLSFEESEKMSKHIAELKGIFRNQQELVSQVIEGEFEAYIIEFEKANELINIKVESEEFWSSLNELLPNDLKEYLFFKIGCFNISVKNRQEYNKSINPKLREVVVNEVLEFSKSKGWKV